MEKIKFIVDSASDILGEDSENLGIEVLAIPITIDDKGYMEDELSKDEFYKLMEESSDIPRTSFISHILFEKRYKKAYDEGYNRIIVSTIFSGGSGMNSAANMAKENFFSHNPELKDSIKIEVLDSYSYTLGTGYAVLEGAKNARLGAGYEEIIAFMKDCYDRMEIYFSVLNLKYVKKSGRVSCAAAFVGDVLNLKPVIELNGGISKIVSKIRGAKNIAPKLCDKYIDNHSNINSDYVLLYGDDSTIVEELGRLIYERTGIPHKGIYQLGVSVASNAGYQVAGIVFVGEKRSIES